MAPTVLGGPKSATDDEPGSPVTRNTAALARARSSSSLRAAAATLAGAKAPLPAMESGASSGYDWDAAAQRYSSRGTPASASIRLDLSDEMDTEVAEAELRSLLSSSDSGVVRSSAEAMLELQQCLLGMEQRQAQLRTQLENDKAERLSQAGSPATPLPQQLGELGSQLGAELSSQLRAEVLQGLQRLQVASPAVASQLVESAFDPV